MDNFQYENYKMVIESGQISLDALNRIIRHERISGWSNTMGAKARIKVLNDCLEGKIKIKKNEDEMGDVLYGINWPLPLNFKK